MSLTSGFFNSRNGDRTYDAEQMSSLFGGIITDGVFKHYPETNQHFNISVSARTITLGPGRAWFNNVWINNDSNYSVRLDALDQVSVNAGYNRVDALYFKVDKSNAGREGTIYVAKGTPATPESAEFVRMTDTEEIFYHIIGIFRVVPANNTIGSWQNRIGNDGADPNTPYIIGPLEAETVMAEMQSDIDAAVQAAIDGYMSDDGSALYSKVTSVPMVWICDKDVPTVNNSVGTLYRSEDYPTSDMAKMYPVFFGPLVGLGSSMTLRLPKPGDAVLGANGYYATIYSVDTHNNGRYYDQYTITVKGTGSHMNSAVSSEPTYLVSFWGGTQDVNPGCDRTYSEIKAAYDEGKLIHFRYTMSDAEVANFDWSSANVFSGTQYEFAGSIANPYFTFKYENFMPSPDDYESCGWENVVCSINSLGVINVTYEAM